jgi:RNA polymerase sigma-70 factor (ECF subfamily)
MFQRAFAVEILESALEQLRAEALRSRRSDMFDALRPYLSREPGLGEYPELAARLKCSPLATVIAVKRLRQRYQELIDAQLVQTVDSAEALDAERLTLLSMLGAGPG